MLHADLAELYHVETKRLNEQVKRNIKRFPEKYMFELTQAEFNILRSQIATSKTGSGGTRYLPMAFTEHGVLQLSNVLKSDRAIEVSFKIIDVFVRLREILTNETELRLEIEQIKRRLDNYGKNMEVVFKYVDELQEKKENPEPRNPIGYQLPKPKKIRKKK
jgi:hypothetical protein